MNRRKYDIDNKELHEKLWAKWQLEATEFYNYKHNEFFLILEESEENQETIMLKAA